MSCGESVSSCQLRNDFLLLIKPLRPPPGLTLMTSFNANSFPEAPKIPQAQSLGGQVSNTGALGKHIRTIASLLANFLPQTLFYIHEQKSYNSKPVSALSCSPWLLADSSFWAQVSLEAYPRDGVIPELHWTCSIVSLSAVARDSA